MIWDLLIILTVILAATALILALRPRQGDRPAPAVRTPGDIPPGWTRNERGALVPPVPHAPQKHAPKHTPKHAATERIHAGGRYMGTLPRRDAPPLTEQSIIVQRPGRPWDTAANPVLRQYDEHRCAVPGEHGKTRPYYCTLPAHHRPLNDDAETLRLGGWGTMPAERVIAAELPQVIA